jgi:O-antigen/teichoic acid export membrane protein
MERDKLKKQYKAFRIAQLACFIASIISCVLPVVISAIRVAPNIKETEDKIALSGVGIFIVAVVVLIVFRSIVVKYISKLPYTLTVVISVGVMLLLTVCLEKIIDDAIAVLIVAFIGAAVAFVLELVSMYLKSRANEIKEIYLRGDPNV